MEEILTSLSTYGYIILFFYSLGGGMVAIIAAGVLSYAGKMDLTLCIVIAAIANTLGDSLLFYMSRYNKAQMAPYIQKHRRKLALSNVLMKKYGDKIIFFQKYVYGIKTLIPLGIGLTKYPFTKFNILNAISSVIWAVSLGLLSYYMGEAIMNFMSFTSENNWVMPLIIFGLLGTIWYYFKIMTKKRR